MCEGDTFECELSEGRLTHKRERPRTLDNRGKYIVTHAYARLKFRDGVLSPPLILFPDDIARIRKFVSNTNGGKLTPMWNDWPDRAVEKSATTRMLRVSGFLDEKLTLAMQRDVEAAAELRAFGKEDGDLFDITIEPDGTAVDTQTGEVLDVPSEPQDDEPPLVGEHAAAPPTQQAQQQPKPAAAPPQKAKLKTTFLKLATGMGLSEDATRAELKIIGIETETLAGLTEEQYQAGIAHLQKLTEAAK